MKRTTLISFMLLIGLSAFAQQMVNNNGMLVKKIEVRGNAKMEIIPDEIYVRIDLKEYKDGSKKVEMNKLEAELVKAVKNIGLSQENLQVENIYGYNWDPRKKRSDDFMATKSFRLKVSNVKMMNDLIDKLDPEGIHSMGIDEVSHSKIEEYRKDLKLKALKEAKQKAEYLLAGIDEEIGSALEIEEIDYNAPTPIMGRSMAMMKSESAEMDYQSNLDFKNITINSEIRAVFEIK
ncbi:SIMPL domain-containing protein [Fulvivirga sediminis]|uniref:SIMPL domain-containing protein n=1 Tax=Fulvivirga sediminis TaxID=2803949 RepID=A0A937K118_9BACT|nr:SIMPL domain-containing protein [Fulvivirga sediminis]MBL3658164.1 SIMPL domain-containing protein [Fulvivirga sediminis]